MTKYLVIPILFLAGCINDFPCCGTPEAVNAVECFPACDPRGGGEDPPPGACGEGKTQYFVWVTDMYCGPSNGAQSFCAADDASAQAYVDANYSIYRHSTPSTNDQSGAPKGVVDCSSNCNLGAEDGSLGTTFYVFNESEIQECEQMNGADCTWQLADPNTNTCPGSL